VLACERAFRKISKWRDRETDRSQIRKKLSRREFVLRERKTRQELRHERSAKHKSKEFIAYDLARLLLHSRISVRNPTNIYL